MVEGSVMAVRDLTENVRFVGANKAQLLKEHRNKFLLILKGELQDTFDTYEKAAEEGVRLFGLDGNFLVHQVLEEEVTNLVFCASL